MEKIWTIKAIVSLTPRTKKFQIKDRVTKDPIKEVTIEQYYLEKYNVRLMEPNLPLVETTKKDVFYPMELCVLTKGQRYPYKLNEIQVSYMLSLENHDLTKTTDRCDDQICSHSTRGSQGSYCSWP